MAASPYSAADRRQRIGAIVGASSGNLVEWFDFYIYAFCALYFAPAFFPHEDATVQLLYTAGVFAAGFLMRPIGGWLFGRIADRYGVILSLAISSFNAGIRGYYFALAALAWLLGPIAFLAATTGMFSLLLWRQFGSETARAIQRAQTEYEADAGEAGGTDRAGGGGLTGA